MKTTNTNGIITAAVTNTNVPAQKTPAQIMNSIVNSEATQKLLEKTLGENAGSFAASVIDLYNTDNYLQMCQPKEVFGECLKAASLKLPINKQLGFAYVIPRRTQGVWHPVFQIGYKGYLQLCMRTGAYKNINAGEVYEGELKKIDKLSGDIDLSGEAISNTIIGYFAYIETVNGFEKAIYWSVEKVKEHASSYSDSYKRNSTIWRDNFHEMATKTVLRYLISHYGVMSVEMENAISEENEKMAINQMQEEPRSIDVQVADVQEVEQALPESESIQEENLNE